MTQPTFLERVHDLMNRRKTYHEWPECVTSEVNDFWQTVEDCKKDKHSVNDCILTQVPRDFVPPDMSFDEIISATLEVKQNFHDYWLTEILNRDRIEERGVKSFPNDPPDMVRMCVTSFGFLDTYCCDCYQTGRWS